VLAIGLLLPNANVGFFASVELDVVLEAAPKVGATGFDGAGAAAPNLKAAAAGLAGAASFDAVVILGRDVADESEAPNLKPAAAGAASTFFT